MPAPKMQRLRLTLSARPPHHSEEGRQRLSNGHRHDNDDTEMEDATVDSDGEPRRGKKSQRWRSMSPDDETEAWPDDVHLSREEQRMTTYELFRLLRRQLHWEEELRTELAAEVETLDEKKRIEWRLKEALLEDVMAMDTSYNEKREEGRALKKRRKKEREEQEAAREMVRKTEEGEAGIDSGVDQAEGDAEGGGEDDEEDEDMTLNAVETLA